MFCFCFIKKKDFGKDDGDDEDDEHDEEDDLYYWTDFMCISEHKHNKTNGVSTFLSENTIKHMSFQLCSAKTQ